MSKLDELIKELCPNGVEYKTLETIGRFFGGLKQKKKDDFIDGNANFISYLNVFKNPSLNLNDVQKVKIGPNENQKKLKYMDVIFTGSSETIDEVAISSVITKKPNSDYYLNSFCFVLELSENEKKNFHPDYLKHLFRSNEIRTQLIKTASGVTRFNVSKDKMKKVKIPVPPLPIQEKIGAMLQKVSIFY